LDAVALAALANESRSARSSARCGGSPCRAKLPSSLTCERATCQQRHQADRVREMIRRLQPWPPPQEPAVVPMSVNRASSPVEPRADARCGAPGMCL
jgi:hypothetical protein